MKRMAHKKTGNTSSKKAFFTNKINFFKKKHFLHLLNSSRRKEWTHFLRKPI